MTKRIFFDLDGTLLYSHEKDPKQAHLFFELDVGEWKERNYTIIRPQAQRVIDYSRELFGAENVFILTSNLKEYAEKVNELAQFNFKDENIIARDDLNNHRYATAYGGYARLAGKYADSNNILIDNLPPRENEDKIVYLGIYKTYPTNYLQVRDYYGTNFPNDKFEEKVKSFLFSHFSGNPVSEKDLEVQT
jgi:FMN phosphatase YigB (HAD superfamily)